ncbi:5'-methylthioadenosine/S-adenosylhomocysteine nucleosidase [Sporolactobacillus sp. CQH2019]|uniref:5'-methylthioadenosine/S-adenosylhomocysteine nucleosidase n=1 Tax=Sporolactobacillus sp. CQH2019 TaxID=3023512 RepID=UPI0023677FFD|nr:5'-methylthioadenosine/S-adenosylhomocysteine nucleosidase [Sporolactobacillus sp. CQH2019]MDD9147630.1 5'-methylthioadenosine/S-adenosylhomocysteine nucleosidase [Sporolactobacillus sp. CQH2019]
MRIGLIGAMEEEDRILRAAMKDVTETEKARCRFYSGRLAGFDAVLLQSGIGKVNAAMGTTLLIDRFQPDIIINTGSAGGTDPDLEIGDVVISSAVIHHDVDATAFGYQPGQVPQMPASFLPDRKLVALAEKAASGMFGGHRTVRGLIATGDSFMSDPGRIGKLKSLFPEMKAVEMEAAAIAQVCYQFGVPFLIVRSLSDIAGKESNVSFDQFLETAAKHSAEFILSLLREIDSNAGTERNRR